VALFNQLRAVGRSRLLERFARVDEDALVLIDEAIKIIFGLIPL